MKRKRGTHHLADQRIAAATLFLGIAAGVVALKMAYLATVQRPTLQRLADGVRTQVIYDVARRGDILDRNGRPVARTRYVVNLNADPLRIARPDRTSALLAALLGGGQADYQQKLVRALRKGREVRCRAVAENLAPAQSEQLRRLLVDRRYRRDLAGLVLDYKPERFYPLGQAGLQPVGYVIPAARGSVTGISGWELSDNDVLSGVDGKMNADVDPRRRVIPGSQRSIFRGADGLSARLTIDSEIQLICHQALAKLAATLTPQGACAIVLDPRSGDILALASVPACDPRDRDAIRLSPGATRNRALDLFECGSVMKPVTMAQALSTGVVTPSSVFRCPGYVMVGNKRIGCMLSGARFRSGHGAQTPREILMNSCNVCTAKIGMALGPERLEEGLRAFGLLSPPGALLPGERGGGFGRSASTMPRSRARVSRVAFGQAVVVSALGLAAAYGAIANGGILMQPRIADGHVDSQGRVVDRAAPRVLRRVVSRYAADLVRRYMEAVVEEGTGKPASVPGYTVAGKTATAQKVKNNVYSAYIASFYGFIPARSPRAVIAVVVDEPVGAHYGATAAAPAWREIAQKLMLYWRVAPDRATSSQQALTYAVDAPLAPRRAAQ